MCASMLSHWGAEKTASGHALHVSVPENMKSLYNLELVSLR